MIRRHFLKSLAALPLINTNLAESKEPTKTNLVKCPICNTFNHQNATCITCKEVFGIDVYLQYHKQNNMSIASIHSRYVRDDQTAEQKALWQLKYNMRDNWNNPPSKYYVCTLDNNKQILDLRSCRTYDEAVDVGYRWTKRNPKRPAHVRDTTGQPIYAFGMQNLW